MVKMLTIKEAAQRYDLAVHALRRWTGTGVLPAVETGKKFLIADVVLADFLTKGASHHAQEELSTGKIRRVDERGRG